MDVGPPDGGALDAAPESDAPSLDARTDVGPDAPRPDAARPDAARDAGPTFPVRVLVALGDDRGAPLPEVSIDFEGTVRTLGFGCLATYDGLLSGVHRMTVTVAGTPTSFDVLVTEPSLVVVARTPAGAIAPYVRADVVPSAAEGLVGMRYLDLVRTRADSIAIAGGAEPGAAITFGTWSDVRTYPAGDDASVGMSYGLFVPRLLVSFLVPAPEHANVVLTGDGDAHPGSRSGARALVVPATGEACIAPILPDAQLVAANLARDRIGWGGGAVHVCQLDSGLAAVAVNPGSVSETTSTFGGLSRFGLSEDASTACTASARIIDVGPYVVPGGRYLSVISGNVRGVPPADWTLTLHADPPPDETDTPGGPTTARLLFVHAAPASMPASFDVLDDATTLLLANDVTVATPVAGSQDRTAVGLTTFRLVEAAAPTTTLRTYPAPLSSAPEDGSAFVIVSDVEYFSSPEPRLDYVSAPYGRAWSLRELRPR
jgi:hypothetical protein